MTAHKKKVNKKVQVTRVVEPHFLTLTDKPANQVAFKVVRSADGKQRMTRQRPTRRMAPTLAIEFPEGVTEEEIAKLMTEFGFSDYKLEEFDGHKVALRADAELPTKYGTIMLKDGVKAWLSQGVVVASDDDPKPHIAVSEIDFNKEEFDTTEKVQEWLDRNDIDFSGELSFNPENKVVVTRLSVEDDTETKRLTVEDGVELVLVRAAEQDVPPVMVEVVSETAYGNWGWGQLDFTASMADIEFVQIAGKALDVLQRVLDQLIYWSYLPLSMRKELIARVTQQYSDFMGELLDSLPAKVVLTEANSQRREKDMKAKELEKRADEARTYLKEQGVDEGDFEAEDAEVITQADTKREEVAAADKVAAEKSGESITRGEVETLLKESGEALRAEIIPQIGVEIRSSLKGIFAPEDTSKRTDGDKDGDSADIGKSIGEAIKGALEPIVKRSDDADKVAKETTETVTKLAGVVEKLAGATTLRSENGDNKQTKESGDVFAGIFGGGRSAAAGSDTTQ